MANAALFCGLMSSVSREWQDVTQAISFDDAKSNFIARRAHGARGAVPLARRQILPGAETHSGRSSAARGGGASRQGNRRIRHQALPRRDRQARFTTGQSGAVWQLKSFSATSGKTKRSEQMSAIAGAMLRNQREGNPVHEWELAEVKDAGDWRANYTRVEQYMSTDLVTVNEEELVDLVACLMEWNQGPPRPGGRRRAQAGGRRFAPLAAASRCTRFTRGGRACNAGS
jgi:hypothetical protein